MKRGKFTARVLGFLLASAILALPRPSVADATGAMETGPAEGRLVSIEADDARVAEILDALAERSGLNIITAGGVEDLRVSIRLRDTPFQEALGLVVRAAGLGYERVGHSILVAPPERLAIPTGWGVRLFPLEHADASELVDLLKVLTPEVAAAPGRDRIVVHGSPSVLDEAAAIVADADRKPRQVLLEARLIEVNRSALLEAGIDWESITRWSTVLTEGNPGASPPFALPEDLGYVDAGTAGRVHRQRLAFQVAVDALLTQGKARLLSNSRVVTLENRAAEIFAGESVPVVISSLASPGGAGGVLQTVQLEKIDVGVKLAITPRVASDGTITTLVEPEVSRIVGFVGPDDDLPQTSMRRARALVRVQDGETVYLGGLLSEETRRIRKGMPLLSEIPLVGFLFRYHREETVRLDLVIEITPRVIGDLGAPIPGVEGIDSGETDAP